MLQFQQVTKMDQILPFFIAEVGASVPGIAGVFVAGIFSAALRFLIEFTLILLN